MKYNTRFKAAPNRRRWFGFDLCQGHIFGIRNGVPYVSAAEPDTHRNGFLKAYSATCDGEYYRWHRVSVNPESEIGKAILAAKEASPYKCVAVWPDRMADERTKVRSVAHENGSIQHYGTAMFTHWPPRSEGNNTQRKGHVTVPAPQNRNVRTWVDEIISGYQSAI